MPEYLDPPSGWGAPFTDAAYDAYVACVGTCLGIRGRKKNAEGWVSGVELRIRVRKGGVRKFAPGLYLAGPIDERIFRAPGAQNLFSENARDYFNLLSTSEQRETTSR